MQRTNIYLEERQCRALDRIATEEGISRAEVVRRLIDGALRGDERDADADLAAIDASFGALADLVLPERGTDDRARHLEEVWHGTPA